jgi:hypothetical protein
MIEQLLYALRHKPTGQWMWADYSLSIDLDATSLVENKEYASVSELFRDHMTGEKKERVTFSIQLKPKGHTFLECHEDEFEVVEFKLTEQG